MAGLPFHTKDSPCTYLCYCQEPHAPFLGAQALEHKNQLCWFSLFFCSQVANPVNPNNKLQINHRKNGLELSGF